MKKNILFIGLGGAGQRHLRIIYKKYGNKFKYFAYRKKRKTNYLDQNFIHYSDVYLNDIYPINYISLDFIDKLKFDYVFISNPTAYHYKFFILFVKKKTRIFIEKPLIFPLNKFSLIKNSNAIFLVGYQRRLTSIFLNLSSEIKQKYNEIHKITINVNSYVPSWHKYENYKDLYACKRNLGGGALLTECHEIDMVLALFGLPNSIKCSCYSDKRLKLNVDTKYTLIANYERFQVIFNVNMFNKNIKRLFIISYNNKKSSLYDLNNNFRKSHAHISKKRYFRNDTNPFEKQIDLFFKSKKSDFKNELEKVYMNNLFLKKSFQSANRKIQINL